ncbi:MAG TPA: thioredoxin [Proteobacteria bacterium]|nr:thioredoxin [Pseudomonadota bacterium]
MVRIHQNIFKRSFSPAYLLLILGAVLIIWGVVLHENKATQRNAIYLCLDCIGIG